MCMQGEGVVRWWIDDHLRNNYSRRTAELYRRRLWSAVTVRCTLCVLLSAADYGLLHRCRACCPVAPSCASCGQVAPARCSDATRSAIRRASHKRGSAGARKLRTENRRAAARGATSAGVVDKEGPVCQLRLCLFAFFSFPRLHSRLSHTLFWLWRRAAHCAFSAYF